MTLPQLTLSFALSLAPGSPILAADSDLTSPPRIGLLAPSDSFSTYSNQFTAADLDGDGDLDLVHLPEGGSSNPGDSHAYWIENLGSRWFAPLRLIHLGPTPAGESLGQAEVWNLLGDSKPEIFVNRRQGPGGVLYQPLSLSPQLDAETPAPIEPTILAASGSRPWDLVDFDGTGNPYIVAVSGASGTGQTIVTARKPNGGVGGPFQEAYTVTSLYYDPHSVVDIDASDVDGDGDFDLCLACDDGKMRIYERQFGSSSSTVEPRVIPNVDPYSIWIDLDGDGRRDILQSDASWHRNDGHWNFTLQDASYAYAMLEYAPFRKIVPRAGQSALVHGIALTEDQMAYEHVLIPFDSTEPILREPAPGDLEDYPMILHYGDLDADGHVDLVYSHSAKGATFYGSRIISAAWGSPTGFSEPEPLYAGPSTFHSVFSADFNADRCQDLVSGPDALGRYHVHYNRGAAGPDAGVPLTGLDITGTRLRIIGAARIDKDKFPDLLCCYTRDPIGMQGPENALVVVRGRKDGSFVLPLIPAGGLTFTPGAVPDGGGMDSRNFIDWDRDGDLDLVSFGLWYENVNGNFSGTYRLLVELGTMPDFLFNPATIGGTITGDIDGDRAPDIISLVHGTGTTNQPPDHMLVAFNDGRGGIGQTVELPIQLAAYDFLGNPTMGGTAVLADLNGDKLPDLWLREVSGTDLLGNPLTSERWLRNPGRRTARDFSAWVSTALPAANNKVSPGVAFGDFDGDRRVVNLKKNIGEWLSPWGYLQSTKRGPIFSEPYDFTNSHIDLARQGFSGGVDIDGDHDTDFILGGTSFPQIILYNPSADSGKRRPIKAKEIPWLGTMPAVR